MHMKFYLLSASVDHFTGGLVLVTKFINLIMEAFDHWSIILDVFLDDLNET